MTEREKWGEYIAEKQKLYAMHLTAKKFEKEIRKLCKRLKI